MTEMAVMVKIGQTEFVLHYLVLNG